ncbi:hypothetical protein AUEXF2481DRAFT_569183 [Aureobasidium subglaciale EXF-2481]|uniref:Uncharacterized protein n=1 Tax=Aureobasidium subglaciale (strain EXF-2481) TaxID=1043005 RepID=A0A074Y8G7_AURSE|nr:uncharacterized protein AUEXF2481DRAFT_569183 [Aureobasidium subglaciale EXF-2481]KEQ90512.1 hypothetical protein AUEXF2481DRAFT_569183 [Aureobasidium subglaciale EXF-2481]
MRIDPEARSWLSKIVEAGLDWRAFRKLSRPYNKKSGMLSSNDPVDVSELLRISYNDFYNFLLYLAGITIQGILLEESV